MIIMPHVAACRQVLCVCSIRASEMHTHMRMIMFILIKLSGLHGSAFSGPGL